MIKRLLIGILVLNCSVLLTAGCNSDASEGPAATTKPLTDEEFEKSIANAPEQAKVRAREEREKAKALMQQGDAPKK